MLCIQHSSVIAVLCTLYMCLQSYHKYTSTITHLMYHIYHIYRTYIKVLLLHDRFLDACLKECLLASQDALNILTKLMGTCLLFADHVHNFTERVHHLGGSSAGGESAASMGNKGLRSRSPIRTTSTSFNTHRPTTTNTNTNTRQSYSTRTSTGSNQEEEDELLLQKRAKTSITNRLKRQLLYNIQSDYIIKESRQESFAKYLILFEDKFDKEVRV